MQAAVSEQAGYVGRIPVRNLWLLMLYASDLFRQLGGASVAIEDSPDEIPDLIAEFLTRLVERRLMRNLSFGYRTRAATLSRVRGRIEILHTERRQLLERGMIACRFDELTVDTPRNRYVRAALDKLAQIVQGSELAHRCRALATSLRRLGVTGEKSERGEISAERFGRHDLDDRQMVSAAQLAFDLALPTEATGSKYLSLPDREITWLRRLYEKAVAGFYSVAATEWRVIAGQTQHWAIEYKTSGIDKILPSMRTDIVLEHATRRIVIDTKFNAIVSQGWYREQTLRSGYVYQIYAYLRSQENPADPLSVNASGLLLHPAVNGMMDEAAVIQGHEIRFATVDLAAEAGEIRRQLLGVVEQREFDYPAAHSLSQM